ncbi:PEP-CTERM sorting domain-containing protein, partial [Armatimonas sp.]|uniref:PEP-CTERM sorting domain-containing protein n=1 Tax=Armatimonas sp. TaxID=1872638 RepID=UPI00286B1F94
FGSYYLTYLEGSDMVYAWDSKGSRVGDLRLLENANATAYSFSYSNGYIFTNDGAQYRGFALSSASSLSSSAAAPEPGTLALGTLGLIGLALRRRRK